MLVARKKLSIVVPVCLFLIFLLLFSAFNSVKYALLVFTGVPLALTGGIVSLWLRGMPFSITAAVGFIALAGVAVLNGLVMVTFINQLRQAGDVVRRSNRRGVIEKTAARPYDGSCCISRIRADGSVHRNRSRGAKTPGYRRHWRTDFQAPSSHCWCFPALYRIFERIDGRRCPRMTNEKIISQVRLTGQQKRRKSVRRNLTVGCPEWMCHFFGRCRGWSRRD